MIRITGRLKGGDMIFKVIDDGKGMTEEELGKLQNSLKKDKSDHKEDGFGLYVTGVLVLPSINILTKLLWLRFA